MFKRLIEISLSRPAKMNKSEVSARVPDALLTTEQVADCLGIVPKTVVWWRSQLKGPKYIRLGKGKRAPIRYKPQAVDEFIAKMESETIR